MVVEAAVVVVVALEVKEEGADRVVGNVLVWEAGGVFVLVVMILLVVVGDCEVVGVVWVAVVTEEKKGRLGTLRMRTKGLDEPDSTRLSLFEEPNSTRLSLFKVVFFPSLAFIAMNRFRMLASSFSLEGEGVAVGEGE